MKTSVKKIIFLSLLFIFTLLCLRINENLNAQTAGNVIATAGDIANTSAKGGHYNTAKVVEWINPAAVLVLGDNQYPDGTLAQYMSGYDLSWGKFKSKTYPVPGNHEYHTPNAQGYFDYFGAAAGQVGKGYYSFNVAGWHMIALNSELMSSTQTAWLASDLAANKNTACTLAYYHHPRWSSGMHGSNARTAPFWDLLYQNRADIVLAGHDHVYERFAPQNPSGQADPNGIRSFVSGAGGGGLYSWSNVAANSEYRQNTSHGVLKLTLNPTSYSWQFIKADGTNAVLDSGSGNCVGGGMPGPTGMMQPTPTPPPTGMMPPFNPRADVNNDGKVNIVDIGIVIDNYGKSPSPNPKADVNSDGKVGIVDIGIIVDNYGR